MGASHGLKIITNSVGRGLAPAVILYQIILEVPLPDEGAVERSETEGVKKIALNYKKLPQSFFCEKMPAPRRWGGSTNQI